MPDSDARRNGKLQYLFGGGIYHLYYNHYGFYSRYNYKIGGILMCDKDDPNMEEICDFCDEEPTTCGRCVEDCITEAAEAHFEAQRDSRD
jgi:hypothetical protein